MIRKHSQGLSWLEFELFQEFSELKHGVFTRKGGFSSPPFDSLNCSFNVGDHRDNVQKNFHKIKTVFGLNKIIFSRQIHQKHVAIVTEKSPEMIENCDGLTTNKKNLALLSQHADCQVAIFFDPKRKVIATVHSGWKGSCLNIYQQVIQVMQQQFQSLPADIYVGISPSLGPKSSEFINFKKELPKTFWKYAIKPFYFDFWEISRDQLITCGILNSHIEIAGIDTYSSSEDFFSYRRDKITGRNATFACLTK